MDVQITEHVEVACPTEAHVLKFRINSIMGKWQAGTDQNGNSVYRNSDTGEFHYPDSDGFITTGQSDYQDSSFNLLNSVFVVVAVAFVLAAVGVIVGFDVAIDAVTGDPIITTRYDAYMDAQLTDNPLVLLCLSVACIAALLFFSHIISSWRDL